ncbi:MAG: BrnA antitoxin family protein [Candidatus Acidiferrum sp.]
MRTSAARYAPETLPDSTKAQRAKLKALASRPDGEIDTSDIPEMTEEQWKNARRGHFYRPRKRQITARVDADVLDWLKGQCQGYQSRINAILRREMLSAVKSAGRRR